MTPTDRSARKTCSRKSAPSRGRIQSMGSFSISCAGRSIGKSNSGPVGRVPWTPASTPATLKRFEEATGRLPRAGLDTTSAKAAWIRQTRLREWVDFKCKVVTDFVAEAQSVLKEARSDAGLGIYVVPDVNGLDGAVDGPTHPRSRAVGRLGSANALPQHFAATAELDRVGARRCRRHSRPEDAARGAGRFQSRPRKRRRLGPSDVGRRLERRAGGDRGATATPRDWWSFRAWPWRGRGERR